MNLTPRAARALARSAYIWAYPLVVNYGRMFRDLTGEWLLPGGKRIGPWLQHPTEPKYRSDPMPIVDGPVFWSAWLDLDVRQYLLTVPATDPELHCVRRVSDLWGHLIDLDRCSSATRSLLRRASCPDPTSDEIGRFVDEVVSLDPQFVRLEISTRPPTVNDVEGFIASVQQQLQLETISPTGRAASGRAARRRWRPYRRDTEITREFWPTANFALSLVEPEHSDRRYLERIRAIGLGAARPWHEAAFRPEVLEGIDQGMEDAISELMREAFRRAERLDPDRSSQSVLDQDYFVRARLAVLHSHLPRH